MPKLKSNTPVIGQKKTKDKSITKVLPKKNIKNYKRNTTVIKPQSKVKDKSNTVVLEQKKPKHESNALVTTDIKHDLLEMLGMKAKIKEIIENQYKVNEILMWYEKKHKNVIEVPEIKINSKAMGNEITSKTFKISKTVLKKFMDFAGKYPQFKMQDLFNMALLEYVERYH